MLILLSQLQQLRLCPCLLTIYSIHLLLQLLHLNRQLGILYRQLLVFLPIRVFTFLLQQPGQFLQLLLQVKYLLMQQLTRYLLTPPIHSHLLFSWLPRPTLTLYTHYWLSFLWLVHIRYWMLILLRCGILQRVLMPSPHSSHLTVSLFIRLNIYVGWTLTINPLSVVILPTQWWMLQQRLRLIRRYHPVIIIPHWWVPFSWIPTYIWLIHRMKRCPFLTHLLLYSNPFIISIHSIIFILILIHSLSDEIFNYSLFNWAIRLFL